MTDGQQRIGALVEVPQILREMGEDPTTVIAGAGIESDLLRNPEHSVSFAELGSFKLASLQQDVIILD